MQHACHSVTLRSPASFRLRSHSVLRSHFEVRSHPRRGCRRGTSRETRKTKRVFLYFQMRIRATRGKVSAAAICPWMVRTAVSTSARTTAAARTAVIRVPRIPTTAHRRTTPRRCRRACTQPSTIPSTNCSWCRVVTSAAITRNPNFPSSFLFLSPSIFLRFIAYFSRCLLPLSVLPLICPTKWRVNEEIDIVFYSFFFISKWSVSLSSFRLFFYSMLLASNPIPVSFRSTL